MTRLLLAAVLLFGVSLSAWAEPKAIMAQLLDCLDPSGRQSAPPLVGARWEVEREMVRRLLDGDGTLDDFFTYHLVTRREVAAARLDAASRSTWNRLQGLVGKLALETGHQAGGGAVLPARAQAALDAARKLSAELPPEASAEARQLLGALVSALESLLADNNDTEELVRLRRRWAAHRAESCLPPARTWELDRSLDALDL